jgi:hypothetical protein
VQSTHDLTEFLDTETDPYFATLPMGAVVSIGPHASVGSQFMVTNDNQDGAFVASFTIDGFPQSLLVATGFYQGHPSRQIIQTNLAREMLAMKNWADRLVYRGASVEGASPGAQSFGVESRWEMLAREVTALLKQLDQPPVDTNIIFERVTIAQSGNEVMNLTIEVGSPHHSAFFVKHHSCAFWLVSAFTLPIVGA